MDDYKFEHLLASCRKNKPKKRGLKVEHINLEHFQFSLKKTGLSDMADMVKLYDWIQERLQLTAHTVYDLTIYHKESPNFWLKNIVNSDEENNYSIGLNLERFIESKKAKSQRKSKKSFYIPDNYELAEKVLVDFNNIPGNDKHSIIDNSYRDHANFESKNLESIKSLADYIQNTYVDPLINELLKEFKIKKCIFKDTTIEFEYEK